jgi:hypothetical protein
MDRTLLILGVLTAAPFAGVLVYNGATDPLAEQRLWMEDRLARIVTLDNNTGGDNADGTWLEAVATRPGAWRSITTPPPAPEAAPPAPPSKPDVKKMLEGVLPTRQQIGDKIKLRTPQSERGEWFVKGDSINGCVISEIDKTSVTFSFNWKEGNETIVVKLPRE